MPYRDFYWPYHHKLITASNHKEHRFVKSRSDIAVTRQMGDWSYTLLTVAVDSNGGGDECVRGLLQMAAEVRSSSLREVRRELHWSISIYDQSLGSPSISYPQAALQ